MCGGDGMKEREQREQNVVQEQTKTSNEPKYVVEVSETDPCEQMATK